KRGPPEGQGARLASHGDASAVWAGSPILNLGGEVSVPEAWRKAADWIFVNALAAAACSVGALLGTALQFGTTSPVQDWPLVGIGLVVAHVLGYRCFPG